MSGKSLKIAMLGAGSWGTALALHLSKNNHQVSLWARDAQLLKNIEQSSENLRYLPGILFPKKNPIHFIRDLSNLHEMDMVVINVPSIAFVELLEQIKTSFLAHSPNDALQKLQKIGIVWATKGLEPSTSTFLSDSVKSILGDIPFAILSGPSFAKEVANALPTAVSLASNSNEYATKCASVFHSTFFRVYSTDDIIGVQLGGVVKNVMAIAVGLSDGLGFGANARCALITRGLFEMKKLGLALGANSQTLDGLSGLGDLVLTCTDNQSRNRRFGLALGQGQDIQSALQSIGQVVEGLHNAEQVLNLAKKFGIEMPICEQIFKIVHSQISPQEALLALLMRTPKSEES